jgi:hypothetical protein
MVTLVNAVHSPNAQEPIVVTSVGIVYDVPDLPAGYTNNVVPVSSNNTPSTLMKLEFASSTIISAKEEHPMNATSPMLATLAGIVTLVKEEHP